MQGPINDPDLFEKRQLRAIAQLRSESKHPFVRVVETSWAKSSDVGPPPWTTCYNAHRKKYVMRKIYPFDPEDKTGYRRMFGHEKCIYASSAYESLKKHVRTPSVRTVSCPSSEMAYFEMDLPHPAFWIPVQKDMLREVKLLIVDIFETMHSLGIIHNHNKTTLDSIFIDADFGVHIIDFQHARLRDDQGIEFDYAADLERRRVRYSIDFDGARLLEQKRTDEDPNGSKHAGMRPEERPRTPPWKSAFVLYLTREADRTRGRILHPRVSDKDLDNALRCFWKHVWEAQYEVISQAARAAPGIHPQTPYPSGTPDSASAPSASRTSPQPSTVTDTPLVEPDTLGDMLATSGGHLLRRSQCAKHLDDPRSTPVQSTSSSPLPTKSTFRRATEQDLSTGPSGTKRTTSPDTRPNDQGTYVESEATTARTSITADHDVTLSAPCTGRTQTRGLQREAAQYIAFASPTPDDSHRRPSSGVTPISALGTDVSRRSNPRVQPAPGRALQRQRALPNIAGPSSLDDVDTHTSATKETSTSASDAIRKGKRKAIDVEEIDDAAPVQEAAVVETKKPHAKRRKVIPPTLSSTEASPPATRRKTRQSRTITTTPDGAAPALRRSSRLNAKKSDEAHKQK